MASGALTRGEQFVVTTERRTEARKIKKVLLCAIESNETGLRPCLERGTSETQPAVTQFLPQKHKFTLDG